MFRETLSIVEFAKTLLAYTLTISCMLLAITFLVLLVSVALGNVLETFGG